MQHQLPTSRSTKAAWQHWLIAAAFVTLLFALLSRFADMHYFNNDDGCILRPFMGYATSTLPTFHLYLNALLVYPLRWLGMAFPGIAWFSYLQLFLLWLACTVSFKSILRCFVQAGKPMWLGLVVAVLYLLAFGMTYCCVITYTVTAAMLGAAAVLQILSVDSHSTTDGQFVRGMMLSLLLVVLAYSLRQITALSILPFCAVALLYQGVTGFGVGKQKRRSWKPVWLTALLVLVVIGGLAGLRELEINAKGMGEYLRWQRARISVMDYHGTENLPDEVLNAIGWSRAELTLVDNWYFMDSNISAQAFETIAAYQRSLPQPGLAQRLEEGVEAMASLLQSEPLFARTLWLLASVLLLSLAGLHWRKTGAKWLLLALAATLGGVALMALVLGMQGRLPLRAALVFLLPAAAFMVGSLPGALPTWRDSPRGAHVILGAIGCLCVALSLWYAVPAALSLAPQAEDETEEYTLTNAFADLDELALQNPDVLYIYDSTFASDMRMFPDTTQGIPTNVLFWGGWGCRSPEYTAQLAAYGLDAAHLDATVFFNENVRLARGMIDPEPVALIAYLGELRGDAFDYNFEDEWGGVHTLQFFSYEE